MHGWRWFVVVLHLGDGIRVDNIPQAAIDVREELLHIDDAPVQRTHLAGGDRKRKLAMCKLLDARREIGHGQPRPGPPSTY